MTRPLAAGAIVACATAACFADVSLTILPDLSPGNGTTAAGLSSSGAMVVGSGYASSRHYGVLYSGGLIQTLPDSPDPIPLSPTEASGVSDSGAVVAGVGETPGSHRQGFLWTRWGSTRALPQTDDTSTAYRISANGAKLVGRFDSPPGNWIIARYDVATSTIQPVPQMTARSGLPTAISDDGTRICGWIRNNSTEQAFYWSETSGVTYLPFLHNSPAATSHANGISSGGDYVVGDSTSLIAPAGQAFLWSASLGMQALPLPAGAIWSGASAVSADGRTVVGACHFSTNTSAMIWDPDHGSRTLLSVALGLGLPLQGWELQPPSALSSDGTRILLNGVDPGNHLHGLVIQIPAPSAGAPLAAAGAWGLRRRRSR